MKTTFAVLALLSLLAVCHAENEHATSTAVPLGLLPHERVTDSDRAANTFFPDCEQAIYAYCSEKNYICHDDSVASIAHLKEAQDIIHNLTIHRLGPARPFGAIGIVREGFTSDPVCPPTQLHQIYLLLATRNIKIAPPENPAPAPVPAAAPAPVVMDHPEFKEKEPAPAPPEEAPAPQPRTFFVQDTIRDNHGVAELDHEKTSIGAWVKQVPFARWFGGGIRTPHRNGNGNGFRFKQVPGEHTIEELQAMHKEHDDLPPHPPAIPVNATEEKLINCPIEFEETKSHTFAGYSIGFSGKGFVQIELPDDQAPQGNGTIELWFKPRQCNKVMSIISQRYHLEEEVHNNDTGVTTVMKKSFHGRGIMTTQNGQIHVWSRDAEGNFQGIQVGVCKADKWVHISLVQEENILKGYYNGELTNSLDMKTYQENSYNGYFTVAKFTDLESEKYGFVGQVDELRVWDVARTREEVRCNVDTEVSGEEKGLAAYYRFDEGCGVRAHDFTHEVGHHGELVLDDEDSVPNLIWLASSAPVYELSRNCPAEKKHNIELEKAAACPNMCTGHGVCDVEVMACMCYTGWVGEACDIPNYAGYALIFNGVCDYLEVPAVGPLDAFSFEMWFKPADVSGVQTIYAVEQAPSIGQVYIELSKGKLGLRVAGSVPEEQFFNYQFHEHIWVHITIVYSKVERTARLYINGKLDEERNYEGTLTADFTSAWIGANPTVDPTHSKHLAGSHFFRGKMDEVRLWDVARAPAHVKYAFHRRLNAPLHNLALYYRYDEGVGRIAHDKSNHSRHGFLGGEEAGALPSACRPKWTVSHAPFAECPRECNYRGDCWNGTCTCQLPWGGSDCSQLQCPNGCSGHGDCQNGTCYCDPGYSGLDCSMVRCPLDCSGHGRCENGSCKCHPDYTGDDCGVKRCPRSCSFRGDCVNGTCRCDDGFAGEDCSKSDECPNQCHGNGVCIRGKCVCDPEWTGIDCSWNALCPNFCSGRGTCIDDKCACHDGWTAIDCSEKRCPNDCSLRGDCAEGKCYCQEGYTGPDCSERTLWPQRCLAVFAQGHSAISCSRGPTKEAEEAVIAATEPEEEYRSVELRFAKHIGEGPETSPLNPTPPVRDS
eukprot:GILJ01000191.1.p1 GENE.GILJ01000191.1~~GILJ01000191.1.p1  ORF type:complete len:1107 (-),score=150.58 GILJ01000191.1:133-3453(-)